MKATSLILSIVVLGVAGGIVVAAGAEPPGLPPGLSQRTLDILSGPVYVPAAIQAFGHVPGYVPPPAHAPSSEGFSLGTLAAQSLFTVGVTNDLQHDVEPSIISALGSNATSTCYIKRTNAGPFRNFSGFTTDFSTWTRKVLPIPAGYTYSADPLQDANVFDTGVAPRRIYCVGIIYNGAPTATPNSIGVWRSDDGGNNWSSPTLVATNNSTTFFLDKPDVGVSWYSGTRGYVYVAYVRVNNGNPNLSELFVARSTNGGVSFSTPVRVAQGLFQGPQMLGGPFGGRIYVVWTDLTNERLLMAWSDNLGASWTAPEVVASGDFLSGSTADRLNGNVRAVTLSAARYNSVDNSIGVVWHEKVSGTTDVYFARKNASGWSAKRRINPLTANDQFMPALDFDTTGNYVVTYYDRSQDASNLKYREFWVQIDASGTILDWDEVAGGFESDPSQYFQNFIGDYQDIWWWSFSDTWGDRFNGVWIGRPSTRVNPYVSGIQ